jgi:hypothetical protein
MTLLCDHTTLGSNRGNHGPVVGAPMAPHVAAPIHAQTAGMVTITAKTVTGNATEAAARVIVSKAITSATATMTAAAGKCAGGKPEISENKDDCKNDYGFAQH